MATILGGSDFFFFFITPSRKFYGFVDGIEEMGGGRIAVQFDAVDAEAFEKHSDATYPDEALGYIRIVSTRGNLRRLMASREDIVAGDWVELELSLPQTGGTRAWMLRLEGDRYRGRDDRRPERRTLISLRMISRGTDGPSPRPLSSGVPTPPDQALRLRRTHSLAPLAADESSSAARILLANRLHRVRIKNLAALDVGQASFNAMFLNENTDSFVFFDVGKPLWFNIHSFPKRFHINASNNSIVILSHWDTDHYLYGRENANFHKAIWIAPAQSSVGPNAYKFAVKLVNDHQLHLISRGFSCRLEGGSSLNIIRCNGNNINNSGLALRLQLPGNDVLLTGDCDYSHIPGINRMRLTALQVPHHGGRQPAGSQPFSHPPSKAVASVGIPNRYNHPNQVELAALAANGWNVVTTAASDTQPRGPKSYC